MKLILCLNCGDIIKLTRCTRYCVCGKIYGWYEEDDLHATISNKAIPIGIGKGSFCNAVQNRPQNGSGSRFEAFVIPKEYDTIRVMEE